MDDYKWLAIMMITIVACFSIGTALEQYEKSQCRMKGFDHGMTVEQITTVCGK